MLQSLKRHTSFILLFAAALQTIKLKAMFEIPKEPLYLDKCIVCCETDLEDYFEIQELSSKETFIFKAFVSPFTYTIVFRTFPLLSTDCDRSSVKMRVSMMVRSSFPSIYKSLNRKVISSTFSLSFPRPKMAREPRDGVEPFRRTHSPSGLGDDVVAHFQT